tara:strand:+ start:31 stop:885 length:855 start_codon:yes stop_codon:yes gene_type:complete
MAIGTGRTNGGRSRRHLVLLVVSLGHIRAASLKRPSSSKFNIDFEADSDVALPCDFSEGDVVKEQYASKMALFSGPGFGGLNGGVRTGGCAVGRGDLPPLSNASFTGLGLLGFSTLHMLSDGRTGKPVSPETVRFDVRMTNIRLGLAALDGNDIIVELCAARRRYHPRRCRLLPCQPSPLMSRVVLQTCYPAGTRARTMRTTTKAIFSSLSRFLVPLTSFRMSLSTKTTSLSIACGGCTSPPRPKSSSSTICRTKQATPMIFIAAPTPAATALARPTGRPTARS